jgi:carboxylate-amine ligase
VIEQRFGERPAWTVGVEEELFVLDRETLEPVPVPPEILDGTRLKAELFAAVVELNTGICETPEEAARELASLRAEAKERAGAHGLVLAAVGTWPTAVSERQAITQDDGYLRFVDYAGSAARRQFCSGLHVHVGIESPEACMQKLEAVLPWLPVVLAVSANSPYVAGSETGLASARAEILALRPRAGAPPVFSSYGDWERFADGLVELGLADRYTRIWWDVRPHPDYGTLEVRMPDQPTRLETTTAFVALLHALVRWAEADGPADRGVYDQNRWAALRFGPSAELIHPKTSRLVQAADLLAELLGELGEGELAAALTRLSQAEEQLEIGRRDGLRTVCERLVGLT